MKLDDIDVNSIEFWLGGTSEILPATQEQQERWKNLERNLAYYWNARTAYLPTIDEMEAKKDEAAKKAIEESRKAIEIEETAEQPTIVKGMLRVVKEASPFKAVLIWRDLFEHRTHEIKFRECEIENLPRSFREANQDEQEKFKDLIYKLRIAPYCIALGHLEPLINSKHPNLTHQLIAENVLRFLTEKEPEGRDVDELSRYLLEHTRKALEVIDLKSATLEQLLDLPEQDGMLLWDARAANYLDLFKKEGATQAESLRTKARERWTSYKTKHQEKVAIHESTDVWSVCWANTKDENAVTPLKFIWVLAKVLWLDVVQRYRAKPRALVFPVLKEAIDAHTPGGELQRHQGDNILVNHRNEKVSDLRRVEPLKKVPALELRVLPQILRKGSKLLGTLNAYRLLHLEVSLGHQHALDDNNKDVRALRFEGGWEALAEAAGIPHNKSDEVHAIIAAQAHLCFVSPDGSYGNLLSYEVRPARRNQRGRVSLILGDALLPDFIFSPGFFGNSRAAREARRLVPMLPLPPLIGRPNDQGAQVNLQLRILAEMRKRAAELYQEGGILLSRNQLEEFAKDATLPLATLSKVIDRWTKDGDDGNALLEVTEENRYTLGKTYVDARNFIAKAGEEEIQGKEAGLKSRELDRKRQS